MIGSPDSKWLGLAWFWGGRGGLRVVARQGFQEGRGFAITQLLLDNGSKRALALLLDKGSRRALALLLDKSSRRALVDRQS